MKTPWSIATTNRPSNSPMRIVRNGRRGRDHPRRHAELPAQDELRRRGERRQEHEEDQLALRTRGERRRPLREDPPADDVTTTRDARRATVRAAFARARPSSKVPSPRATTKPGRRDRRRPGRRRRRRPPRAGPRATTRPARGPGSSRSRRPRSGRVVARRDDQPDLDRPSSAAARRRLRSAKVRSSSSIAPSSMAATSSAPSGPASAGDIPRRVPRPP